MYICTCTCVYIHIHVYTHTCIYVCTYMCIYRHTYTYTYTQVLHAKDNHVRALAGVKPQPQLAHLTLAANPISTLTYYRPLCVHAFRPRRVGALLIDAVRVYMYTCIYLQIHTDIHTHMYICTYIHRHRHIQQYIYTGHPLGSPPHPLGSLYRPNRRGRACGLAHIPPPRPPRPPPAPPRPRRRPRAGGDGARAAGS